MIGTRDETGGAAASGSERRGRATAVPWNRAESTSAWARPAASGLERLRGVTGAGDDGREHRSSSSGPDGSAYNSATRHRPSRDASARGHHEHDEPPIASRRTVPLWSDEAAETRRFSEPDARRGASSTTPARARPGDRRALDDDPDGDRLDDDVADRLDDDTDLWYPADHLDGEEPDEWHHDDTSGMDEDELDEAYDDHDERHGHAGRRGARAREQGSLERRVDERNLRSLLGPDRGPRWRVGVGAAVVLVLVALAATVLLTALRPGTTSVVEPMTTAAGESPVEAASADGTANAEPSVTASASLIVHVSGAVLAPGVHELADGSRVLDAVQAAGGFAEGADEQALNLARPLVDGEQIRVPVLGEAAPPEHAAPDGATSLVNLNTASSNELQELPGVGEAIAGRIIAYREEHGGFTSVDELLQVSGIGEATFAELEALVTV